MCRPDTFNTTRKSLPQRGFSILELLVVVVVIGILITTAYRYLQDHITEAEKATLTSLSRDFAVSMSMIRNKWIVEGKRTTPKGQRVTQLEDSTVYLNQSGWPIATRALDKGEIPTAEDCAQLWNIIMQYSVATTVEGASVRGDASYHISSPGRNHCRYELAYLPKNHYYFDYLSEKGEVKLNRN
ncbi:MAG: prepilin-type N-terminal cleavage/methylation domain-containing protein [Porticoccaceae bacterium]|nr:prepilin-type N-terminal cleavage/methylation domain-containing protein [Pseudomonadales bacterium]MCP5172636.1 prepilin-type N-terminal cleavage/methylation domain-containing protein [Pseudomonadales bacterium]MCP5302110.1 prepilin-type N-terminal cleavage/methylation domain-containing protein [Pseudomonadales bacterium]